MGEKKNLPFSVDRIPQMIASTDRAIEAAVHHVSRETQSQPPEALFMLCIRCFDGMMDFAPEKALAVFETRDVVNQALMRGKTQEEAAAEYAAHGEAVEAFWDEVKARATAKHRQN